MQAVIFAAGKSTRTYPLTVEKPKPLLKIVNKTIIEHNLEQLSGIVDEAIIIIGHKGDTIKTHLEDKYKNVNLKYVEQENQDGNGSALLLAKDLIKNRFIAMVGDDLFYRKDIKKCVKHKYCVLVKEAEDLSTFGQVIGDNGFISEFKEKPGKFAGLANTGLLILDKEVFKFKLKLSVRGEYELVDYIKYLITDDKDVNYEVAEFWLPITYPWNLLEANEIMLSEIKTSIHGKIEKGVTIKGQVKIGKNTLVKAGAYIEGPVVIGKNCVIGPNCYIRAFSVIGHNSKIGNAVEIKNSVIGDHCCVGHLSYVGDSIIGDHVNFGAGTITANLRHDDAHIESPIKGKMVSSGRRKLGVIIGDYVHTGINTSIYPGRKIWPGKTTLPGEVIKMDVD